ncbi:HWE histidine kinase domain-containing protein [Methylobacterium durans]|uniref:sensor histidine kinase n=1 Tax=Methylobacterium durans TaxID=2202825 RepID=UPI002AFEA22A|nr:HWE histidine kinase domain-containing protein [Methylobacterium durans]MEA1830755.1 HWE histidine kinase domain-containing protein [Methylobacterium durans]
MTRPNNPLSERVLILAPLGRDAPIAASLLGEAQIPTVICGDLSELHRGLEEGAGMALLTEEAVRSADLGAISRWIEAQPPWSDMPFVLLTGRGGGPEQNPAAARLSGILGNVTFLERPFHPMTLVSVVRTALRGRRRQYEARTRLEELREGESRLKTALTAEQRGAEHQRLLIDELNHRVKNTLATVQSIATQTLRNADTNDEAYASLETRLLALSRAHDVLTRENWEGADLVEVVTQAIAPYRGRDGERFLISGPEVRLCPRMSLAIAMAIQELATNAVKYGALSKEGGAVEIDWAVRNGSEPPRLAFRWTEVGGPSVKPPKRRGFGSRLIERNLARDLDGAVAIDFAPTGVVCTVDAPIT